MGRQHRHVRRTSTAPMSQAGPPAGAGPLAGGHPVAGVAVLLAAVAAATTARRDITRTKPHRSRFAV